MKQKLSYLALNIDFKISFFFENHPVLPLIKLAALGNLNASVHCAHLHSFFPLRKAPPLISVFFNGLYTPFGSPVSGEQKPQGKRGNRSSRRS